MCSYGCTNNSPIFDQCWGCLVLKGIILNNGLIYWLWVVMEILIMKFSNEIYNGAIDRLQWYPVVTQHLHILCNDVVMSPGSLPFGSCQIMILLVYFNDILIPIYWKYQVYFPRSLQCQCWIFQLILMEMYWNAVHDWIWNVYTI